MERMTEWINFGRDYEMDKRTLTKKLNEFKNKKHMDRAPKVSEALKKRVEI